MSKKRNCRYTLEEAMIHDQAVKIRKMTDVQILTYIDERVVAARMDGIKEGQQRAKESTAPAVDVESLIDEISKLRGIGAVKMKYIGEILQKRLGGAA